MYGRSTAGANALEVNLSSWPAVSENLDNMEFRELGSETRVVFSDQQNRLDWLVMTTARLA